MSEKIPQIMLGDPVWFFNDRHTLRSTEAVAAVVAKVGAYGILDLHLFVPDVPGSIPRATVRHYTATEWPIQSEDQGCWSERDPEILADYVKVNSTPPKQVSQVSRKPERTVSLPDELPKPMAS